MKNILILLLLFPAVTFAQNEMYPGSPPLEQFKFLVDETAKTAYFQEVIYVDSTLKKDFIYERAKQFVASAVGSSQLQLNYDNASEGKLIYTTGQNLYIPQGLGTAPFEVRYTFTIEVKDGRYRYTVDNIEIGYTTLMTNAGKRERLFPEWLKSGKGKFYNNNYKRILSLQKHLADQIALLNNAVSSASKSTKDF